MVRKVLKTMTTKASAVTVKTCVTAAVCVAAPAVHPVHQEHSAKIRVGPKKPRTVDVSTGCSLPY